jgi:hypothetical protein
MTNQLRILFPRIVFAVAIIAAGLALRSFTDGPIAKYGGVALYAALVYTLVSIARPSARRRQLFIVSLAICFAIELFQLTSIPTQLAARHRAFALVLGTTFHWFDLLAYTAGAAIAAAVHGVFPPLPPSSGGGKGRG